MKRLIKSGFIFVLLACVSLWSYDPIVWKVRRRFPNANVADCRPGAFLLPPCFRASVAANVDLYDGGYLIIEIANQSVDLSTFRDVPFMAISLNRCRVASLDPVATFHLGNREIKFRDCDLSGVPPSKLGLVPDAHHCTFRIGGP
jgi:hypothetical protein